MDQVPWPKLRDRLIHRQDKYGTAEFRHLHTASLSVNWPHSPMNALIFRHDHDEVVMSPEFEAHINRLDSWSLGPRFAARYPELEPLCSFGPQGVVHAVPAQGMPGRGMAPQGLPGQGMPGQGMPGHGVPGQGIPGPEMSAQGMPGQGLQGQSMAGHGMAGQGLHAQGIPGQGMPGPA